MKFGRIFIAVILAFPAVLAGKNVLAGDIPEEIILEVYQALMRPVCLSKNETEATSLDCDTPDPKVFQCWREKFKIYYDEASLLKFLEEIKASNEKYKYFSEPYYNEFFSDRNWDKAMDFSNSC